MQGGQVHAGSWAAVSGTITHNQQTSMTVTHNVPGNATITFWHRESSEGSFDYLRFYIDNALLDGIGLTEKDSDGYRLRTDNGERSARVASSAAKRHAK